MVREKFFDDPPGVSDARREFTVWLESQGFKQTTKDVLTRGEYHIRYEYTKGSLYIKGETVRWNDQS